MQMFNDASLMRYDVMLRIMILLLLVAMMRCMPKALGKAVIISETASFAEGIHHKKRPDSSN